VSKNILVVGATGVTGSAFVEHIRRLQQTSQCSWNVTGVTRSVAVEDIADGGAGAHDNTDIESDTASGSVSMITADLLADHSAIRQLRGITHVVFAGFVPAADFAQQVAPNRGILINCLRALDSNPVERVVLIQGMKYYGSHLGPFKTPAREDDPRHDGENYYYAQQDVLEQSGVDWTCLRPHVICGTTSIGTPQNILSVVGVYASLMRANGRPLTWPGTPESFHSINQATDASLLAKAIAWALDSAQAKNQAFNVTNGDFFRWQNLWPKVAERFHMSAGGVETQSLAETMPELSAQWQLLVEQGSLKPYSMESIVNWPFADYILRTGWDVMASTIKIRQAGFSDCLDTEQMYINHLAKLQELKVLPC
jgi:nucleoside-diphosphate-sugar epimerase